MVAGYSEVAPFYFILFCFIEDKIAVLTSSGALKFSSSA